MNHCPKCVEAMQWALEEYYELDPDRHDPLSRGVALALLDLLERYGARLMPDFDAAIDVLAAAEDWDAYWSQQPRIGDAWGPEAGALHRAVQAYRKATGAPPLEP